MKRAIWYAVVLLPALTVLAFTQILSAEGAKCRVRHTIVAASGDAAPAGGNYLIFSFINASLNARHSVAFDAFISGQPPTSGIFVRDGKTTSTVALGANPDPAAPSFGTVMDPFITNNGEVVFNGDLGVFRSNGRSIVPLVRIGDPVPGVGTLASLLGARAVNDRGAIAYAAGVSGAAAGQVIFRADGARTTTIARDDVDPPTGGKFTALLTLDMNNRGQVAFKSEMTGGSADNGVFRGEGGRLTPIFVTNQIAPGGATFQDFSIPEINEQGQVATIGLLTNGASNAGMFVGDGRETVAIALDGQPAPKGGNYSILESFKLNDRGEVAFLSRLTGASSGVFRGNGKRTTTLALAGTSAPGTTGVFQSFGDVLELENDGRVAFVAQLATGVGGVDSSNNLGIWVGTSEEDLKLLVRTGDNIDGKVLTNLPFFDITGHPLDMNGNDVLWRGSFGAVKAFVLSRIAGDDNGGNEED